MIAQYKKMRQSGQYDLVWFLNYYNSKKPPIDINNFQMIFNMGNLSEILEYLDKKFELVKLEDKNGNLIKIL